MRKIDIFDAVTDAVSVAGVNTAQSDKAGRLLVFSTRGGARVECGAWFNDCDDAMHEFSDIANTAGLHIMGRDELLTLWRDFGGYLSDIAECDGFDRIETLAVAYDEAAGVTLIAFSGKLEI
ncbi:hypothetical protein [Limosilactobacillus mucosae]|uniref:hypothetical protein n=1 Tax=Limosilactobacillus mucosae TaxID=97478 RepID=UPI000FFC16F6|nr:hypothetical protein [Limosilactobacillus mucosae]RXA58133.1 hypothetical protein EQ839_02770 [Limosilactobacillus mucosae]